MKRFLYGKAHLRDSPKIRFLLKQKTDYFNSLFCYFLLISFTFLSGCQTLNINPNKDIYTYNNFVKDKGYTGTFKFYPNDSGHEMILLSPLNQIISKISVREEILIEYQNKEDQNIKNFIKDLPIKEFKRILYTEYDNKPIRVDTGYCEISVEKLLKIETLSGFEPKIIKVKNKDIELSILLQ